MRVQVKREEPINIADMITAAVSSSLRVFSMRPAGWCGSSSASTLNQRHDCHARFETAESQGQLGKIQQARKDDHADVAARRPIPLDVPIAAPNGRQPLGNHRAVRDDIPQAGEDHDRVEQQVHADQRRRPRQSLRETHAETPCPAGPAAAWSASSARAATSGMSLHNGLWIRCTAASAAESVLVITKSVAAKPSSTSTRNLPVQPCSKRLQHGDRTLPVRRLAGHVPVHGQRTEERHSDQHDRRKRRQQPGRIEGNGRLIPERAEIIHARQAHHPQPETLMAVSFRNSFGNCRHRRSTSLPPATEDCGTQPGLYLS